MQPTRRFGLTLVELLVVIVLLTILTAAVLPIMAPAVESRRMREAARGVSIFFSTARSRAIQNGRPVGVEIVRVNYTATGSINAGATGAMNNSVAIALFEVEVQPAYAGDDTNSSATVQFGALDANGVATGTMTIFAGGYRPALVNIGDRIQFRNQGPLYTITVKTNPLSIVTSPGTVALPPWTATPSQPMSYQIFRKPKRTSSDPYQFPEGIVLDMDGSGIGPSGQFVSFDMTSNVVNDPFSVVVMFAPSGFLTSVYQANSGPFPPAGDLFLLIGKREKAPLNHTLKNYNWLDPECLWVTVRRQTGQVTTTAMAPSTVPTVVPPDAAFPGQLSNSVFESRFFAREAYGEKGR